MSRPSPQSYLLRLWREHAGAPMRATLVLVGRPDVQQHFADLEALHAFLRAQLGEEPGAPDQWNTTCLSSSEIS
jgi:hypothetical protein